MKKLNLLLGILIGLTILSCSSDDDDLKDTIIGTWKPLRFVEVYTNAGETVYEHTICYQQSRMTFSSKGKVNSITFEENNNGECQIDDSDDYTSGTWEKTSNNQYLIKLNFFNLDTQQNEVFEGKYDEIIFPNKNIMRIVFNEGNELNGDFLEYEYDEFVRVE
jgi:hypothetical protein